MIHTKVIKIKNIKTDSAKIKEAARIIKEGGLVAFPTETVYGLGADALSARACAKIFEVKNRPLDDPLIVHIAERDYVARLTKEIPDIALRLIEKFWPGPLTLVLQKSKAVPDIVTAGLDTVAIRMPANEIALSLIRESETPIAAPSANIFGRTSSVTAAHVLEDLDGRIDLILDGGKTTIGVESTVLDLTEDTPTILRPGGVSLENIKKITKEVKLYKEDKILSPGMYPRHYSPRAKLIVVEGEGEEQVEQVRNLAGEFKLQGYRFGIMAKEENKDEYADCDVKILGRGDDLETCAAQLYSILREFDAEGVDVIIAESIREDGLGHAIMDRLRKAGGKAPVRCPQSVTS